MDFITFLQEHSLLVLLLIGTVFTWSWSNHFRTRLRASSPVLAILAVLHTIYGVLCVSLFAIIEGFGDLSVVGNMSLFGAVFFMPIGYAVAAKLCSRSIAEVFDIYTVPLIFTLFCARINCILSGCCRGRLITFLSGRELRYPTRQAELLLYLILMICLGKKLMQEKTDGKLFPIYITTYGAFRFVCEFFRSSGATNNIFHIAHLWAIITLIVGVGIYSELNKATKKRTTRKGRKK